MNNDDTTNRPSERSLTADQEAQLAALDGQPIDTVDIPEAPARNWSDAQRGAAARRGKEPISIRIDHDVLVWLRARKPGYQTEINRILRQRMEAESKQG
jgi:uncharacterized protein (DUF4415 family)